MVIAVINTKGGVAKTTTAVHLAALFARRGATLLVDADSQAGASLGLGIPRGDLNPSLAHALLDGLPLARAVRRNVLAGMDFISGSAELASTDVALADVTQRERRLRELFDPVRRRYDAIVIDCPPGLSLLQLNALVAADWYLVPVSPQYLALEGVAGVLAAADRARERFALRLRLLGMLVTMMDARSASARAVVRMLRGYYRDAVFRSEIPFATALADAPSFGRTIFQHQHASPAGEAYRRLFTEILRRVDRRPARGN